MPFHRRLAWGLGLVLLGTGVSACSSCGKSGEVLPPDAVSKPEVVENVPAPEDLLAEATVLTPNATWKRV